MDEDFIRRLRADTPGVREVAHFNHSGASLPSVQTLDTIIEHLRLEAAWGPMEAAARVSGRIEEVRLSAARLVGARPDEIAFLTSGSAAWGAAYSALPPMKTGDRVLVGRQEWGGNLATLYATAARAGVRIETIPVGVDGGTDAVALANLIDERVKLISLTWLPANGGLINDAAAIGKIARAADIPYFIDAGQALGHIPVDVNELGCDVLKGAGRKFLRGPRGTAILYVRRGFQERLRPTWLDVSSAPIDQTGAVVRSDAGKFETSEKSVALLLGLGVAIDQANDLGTDWISGRILPMAARLRQELENLPGVEVQDLGTRRSGIVSFTIDGKTGGQIRDELGGLGINIGANGVPYTPLDMKARGLDQIARASVSYLNTDGEIDLLVQHVAKIKHNPSRSGRIP